jgi:hypothetical protein
VARQDQGNSYTIPLAHSTHSATKLNRRKKSTTEGKKPRKNKHTISVINLGKSTDESKGKGSSTMTKRKPSAVDFGDRIKEKIEDFRVIANCLEEYTREERRNNAEVNLG